MNLGLIEDVGFKYFFGTPLLEVFSITISKDNETENCSERRAEIYGIVRVTDERGTKAVLYDREPQNSESVNQNETLTLRGPPRSISALTAFTIDLNLRDKNQDLEINNGKICWDMKDAFLQDKLLAINVPGRNGYATVNCAAFSVAKEANFEIELISNATTVDNNSEFYGTIVAYYGQVFDYSSSERKKYFRTTLFNRSAGNRVQLEPGKPIPLLKTVMAVPGYAALVIEADLFLYDSRVRVLKGSTRELQPDVYVVEAVIKGGIYDAKVTAICRGPLKDDDFK